MKTGVESIAHERQYKQIEKHGFTGEHHADNPQWYDKGQLVHAANLLSYADDDVVRQHVEYFYPENWDKEWFTELMNRPNKERLIIAGALLASEIDRLNELEKRKT